MIVSIGRRISFLRAALLLVDGLAIDQWLILKDVLKGQGLNTPIEESALFAWLTEAVLISRDKPQIAFSQLCTHPALFPIALDTFTISHLQDRQRLRVERQCLNQEFVFLEAAARKSKT